LSKYNYKRFKVICEHILNEFQPDSLVSEIGAKRKAIYFDEDISISSKKYFDKLDYLQKLETQTKMARLTSFFRKKYYDLVKKHLYFKKEIIKCYAGLASCDIYYDGEVRNCPVRADSMGNLRKHNYDIKEIWKLNQANNVRGLIKKEKCFCNTANPNYTNMIINFDLF
jgi:MoaA/NifB/PqqE/SkfB family radical SAM enzyme